MSCGNDSADPLSSRGKTNFTLHTPPKQSEYTRRKNHAGQLHTNGEGTKLGSGACRHITPPQRLTKCLAGQTGFLKKFSTMDAHREEVAANHLLHGPAVPESGRPNADDEVEERYQYHNSHQHVREGDGGRALISHREEIMHIL